jgi:DNA-binding CsgD family transcriptional regulator
MLGYAVDELIGMDAMEFVATESRDLVMRNIASQYEVTYEHLAQRRDGSTFPVEVHGVSIPYEGRMARVTAIRDITERKRAEEALQNAREELEGKVERQMLRRNPYGLTFRELTVLHLVAAGKSDKEIGLELGISPLTAQKHVSNILTKMDAASRTEASVRAVKEGLLD